MTKTFQKMKFQVMVNQFPMFFLVRVWYLFIFVIIYLTNFTVKNLALIILKFYSQSVLKTSWKTKRSLKRKQPIGVYGVPVMRHVDSE